MILNFRNFTVTPKKISMKSPIMWITLCLNRVFVSVRLFFQRKRVSKKRWHMMKVRPVLDDRGYVIDWNCGEILPTPQEYL